MCKPATFRDLSVSLFGRLQFRTIASSTLLVSGSKPSATATKTVTSSCRTWSRRRRTCRCRGAPPGRGSSASGSRRTCWSTGQYTRLPLHRPRIVVMTSAFCAGLALSTTCWTVDNPPIAEGRYRAKCAKWGSTACISLPLKRWWKGAALVYCEPCGFERGFPVGSSLSSQAYTDYGLALNISTPVF